MKTKKFSKVVQLIQTTFASMPCSNRFTIFPYNEGFVIKRYTNVFITTSSTKTTKKCDLKNPFLQYDGPDGSYPHQNEGAIDKN